MKKRTSLLLLFFCLTIFVFSVSKLYHIWREYRIGSEIYDSLKEQVSVSDPGSSSNPSKDSMIPAPSIPDALVDLDALIQINEDAIGWIRIPDTEIDYPILQADDNERYLRHTITGEYNKAGSIFADCRNTHPFKDTNTILYGHNLLNGKMFSNLMKYEDWNWWESHPYIYIQTAESILCYEIYSCYQTTADSRAYTFDMEPKTEAFQTYIDDTIRHTLYYTGITPGSEDRILTLSTCTNEDDQERFVVHARLVTP